MPNEFAREWVDKMINTAREGVSQDLNVDLWSVPLTEMAGLLEAVSADCFVTYVFSVLLHRSPDPTGAAHYRQMVYAGRSRQSVVADLLASDEFLNRHGARARRRQPIEEFVNQTYQDVLGRRPDEAGRQTYMRIGRKWRGRAKVERNIINSAEGRRLGGGRLARIKQLRNFARQARILRMPLVGTRLRRHNEIVARLAKIERLIAMRPGGIATPSLGSAPTAVHPQLPVGAHSTADVARELTSSSATDGDLTMREVRIETLDAATATKLEKDGWVFKVAMRDARRKQSARSGSKKART